MSDAGPASEPPLPQHPCHLLYSNPLSLANTPTPLQCHLPNETSTDTPSMPPECARFRDHHHQPRPFRPCHSHAIRQPRLIAAHLKLSAPATKNLQKRLKRRLRQFLQQSSRAV